MNPSKCNHAWVLNIKPAVCLWCGIRKGTKSVSDIKVDDGIKIPKPTLTNKEEYRAALFADYCYWYKRVYIREPAEMQVDASSDLISWSIAGQRQPGVSQKRLKELTTSLKRRIRHN
jgi:hypothetical protein